MNQISMARGDFILQFFNGIVGEFLDFPAAGTDEVIVMLPFGDMLVSRLAISELDFACDARFGKELERAVHGCISYIRIPGAQFEIEILNAHMIVAGEEPVEYNIALPRCFQPFPGNEVSLFMKLTESRRLSPVFLM